MTLIRPPFPEIELINRDCKSKVYVTEKAEDLLGRGQIGTRRKLDAQEDVHEQAAVEAFVGLGNLAI